MNTSATGRPTGAHRTCPGAVASLPESTAEKLTALRLGTPGRMGLGDPLNERAKWHHTPRRCRTFGRKAPDVRRAGFAGGRLALLAERAAVLAAMALLLVACGEGGGPTLPSGTPSRSAGDLASVTATVPDPTRSPSRPEPPTRTEGSPSPTRSVTRAE